MSRYKGEDYEDWDEYEDDEQEKQGLGEDEYEEEDEEAYPQPTQQELEYLELRNQIKDNIRKKLKKENGSSLGQSQIKKKLPYDNYGSFFGPSQPVIAQRVIQESKSLFENERLTAKVAKPQHRNTNPASTSNGGSKAHTHDNRNSVVTELKHKGRNPKVDRDYSFLLSDDAELPAPRKDPPRHVSGPKSDARPAQVPPKNKQSLNSNGRQFSNGSTQIQNGRRQDSNGRDEKKNVPSTTSHLNPRAVPHKLNSGSKPIPKPVDPRKQLGNHNGIGPGQPLGSKPLPSKVPPGTLQKKIPSASLNSSLHSAPKLSSAKLQSSALKQPLVSRQTSASKQPLVSRLPSCQKQPLGQRKGDHDSIRGRVTSKQPVASSKPQISKPSTKVPSRPASQNERPKKRPARPFSDDEDELGSASGVSSIIHKLMGYNPNKYQNGDSDDSDMEADFHQIQREENRSARIAREEDEEELRKIEEEERRERLRAKKRKLSR